MGQQLRQFFVDNTAFSSNEIDYICSHFHTYKIKTDDIVIRNGQLVNEVGFIEKGIMRAVEITPSGQNLINYFIQEGHFFSEANGLFKSLPAKLNIEAATNCTICSITVNQIEDLIKELPGFETIVNITREQELVEIIETQKLLHSASSLERYKEFLKRYPTIVNQIMDKDIAAYLGISRYTLSHIKSKIGKK